MSKSNNTSNWAWIGCGFVVFSFVNFVAFLLTGSGLPSRMHNQVKGGWAVLGSVAFFVLGSLCLGIWVLLKMFGRGNRH
jgi:hypothetical protein